ncbi:BF3164 family lipoprotein [uncultured Algoriphagus sp.]|uniref:BF3164 family lipoprotein n=1 Tax=uncultured Algoriphagus sp. TaxID=417365 RepID=UPI0030EC0D80
MKYLGIIFILLFVGCTNSEESILSLKEDITFIKKFPEEMSLDFKKLIDYPNGTILKLSESDTGFYMLDIKAKNNHIIHFYSKKENDFKKELIRKGNGPFESFAPYSIDFRMKKILLSDFEMRKIIEIDLENFEANSSEIKLENYYNEVKFYNDSTYIATSSSSSKEKFYFINKKNGRIEYTKGEFQNIPRGIDISQIPDLFQSILGVNLKRNKALNAYRWMDIIEIFDLNTNKSKFIKSPKNIENKLITGINGELALERGGAARECFVDVTYSDNYIYALFSGNEDKTQGAYLSDIIYMFDWNGIPIKQINIDRKIMSISVNTDDKRIYSFDIDTGEVIYITL